MTPKNVDRCAYMTDDKRFRCPKRARQGDLCEHHAAQKRAREAIAKRDLEQERLRMAELEAEYESGDF